MRCANPITKVYIIILSSADYKFQDYNFKLLDIPKPKGPYLMLEINHVDKNKEKGYYIVELKDVSQIKIVDIHKYHREELKIAI